MPLLKGFDAILPKQNDKAPGGVIKKEIAYSGFAIDGRVLTTDDIKEIYDNSVDNFMAKGVMIKVKIGHWQEDSMYGSGDEELKGFIKRLELHQQPSDVGRGYSLYADMHLYPEVLAKWKEGRFPDCSIGNFTSIKDRDGNDIPQLIDHVAIMGAGRGALSELGEGSIVKMFKALFNKINVFSNQNKEVLKMDEKQAAELLELLTAMQAGLTQAVELLSGSSGETEEESKETDTEEKSTTEEERAPSLEVTKAFNKLVDSGNIAPDERSAFDRLVDKAGLDFSITHYSTNKAKAPTKDEQVTSNRDESDLTNSTKNIRSLMQSMGYTTDRIAKDVDSIAKGGVE